MCDKSVGAGSDPEPGQLIQDLLLAPKLDDEGDETPHLQTEEDGDGSALVYCALLY